MQIDAPIPEIEAEDGQPLEGDAVEEGLELVEGDLDGIDLDPVDVAGEEVPESEAETDVESGKAPEVEAVVPVEESAEETGAEEGEGVGDYGHNDCKQEHPFVAQHIFAETQDYRLALFFCHGFSA